VANRDELGRFSSAPNGGGPSFASPVEIPTTRAALFRHLNSHASHAPTMTGGSPEIPAPDFSSDGLHPAFAAGGHVGEGGGGHAGESADDLSDRLTPDALHVHVHLGQDDEDDDESHADDDQDEGPTAPTAPGGPPSSPRSPAAPVSGQGSTGGTGDVF
jgi:hypothetical protein